MFKKRIKVFAILFSVFLMVVLSSIVARNEIDVCRDKEAQAESIVQQMKRPDDINSKWGYICQLKENSFLPVEVFVGQIIDKVDFQRSNDVYWWNKNNELCELDSFDVAATPHLANRIINGEFTQASAQNAISFYQKQMLGIASTYPGFSLWYYLVKFLIVFGISGIPSLLAFLSSLFAISFPITAPITAIVLVFFTMVQGYADDTVITKLMTSNTGEENNLTLGMLYLADKSGALIILPQKGVWGAYGPVWKFSKGMAFFPIGVICGKGENGFRVEHFSVWSISSINVGKFNHVLMGSYNHPLVKDRSPFASVKETLYYTASKLQPGIRVDYLFQKAKKWKKKISIGPTLKLAKKNFGFHIHASLTKPYTIKTEWELAF